MLTRKQAPLKAAHSLQVGFEDNFTHDDAPQRNMLEERLGALSDNARVRVGMIEAIFAMHAAVVGVFDAEVEAGAGIALLAKREGQPSRPGCG